ncbi:MAG: carboxymuconolactone decarboxylase family protein [Rhodobacteraceae bacterium]|nr:carboxymuconolactone decarboxylase family protein [Paracoccaceae bacterium]
MASDAAINLYEHGQDAFQALQNVENVLAQRDLDVKLKHLVKLRASQINGCAYCVKLHTTEARRDGDSNERLDHVIVWRHTKLFSPAEKAALAWTEALTSPSPATDSAPLRRELREHFSDSEITTLTAVVGMINLWNRVQISQH